MHTIYEWTSTVCVAGMLTCVWLFVTPRTVACQAPLSIEFSRQENLSGLPFLCFLHLLNWQVDSLPLSHLGTPKLWVDQFSSVQLFATPQTAAHQASLSITNSWSLLKLLSIKLVMPSNHLILYCPLLLLPSIFPSVRVCSSESLLCIRWPKYWSFSFNISPSNEYSGLISFRIDWLDLLAV